MQWLLAVALSQTASKKLKKEDKYLIRLYCMTGRGE